MKRFLLIVAATVAVNAFAGVGATTNWVAQYVREYVGNAISNSVGEVTANTQTVTTGEVSQVTSGTAECPIVMRITMPSVAALIADDCSPLVQPQGITNGTLWAWNSTTSRYERQGHLPIVPTPTNFLWNAIGSVSDNGKVAFKNAATKLFVVNGTFLTEAQAREVRGN